MRKFAAWLKFGWRTEAFGLGQREVAPPPRKREPFGCMAGTVTILPGTDLMAPSDEQWNAEEGRPLND